MDDHLTFEELSRRLDGEVSPFRREEIDAHLTACVACRKEYETITWIESLARDIPKESVPPGFAMRLPPEVRGQSAAGTWLTMAREWFRQPTVLAMGAAAAVLLIIFAGRAACVSSAGAGVCPDSVRTALGYDEPTPGATLPTDGSGEGLVAVNEAGGPFEERRSRWPIAFPSARVQPTFGALFTATATTTATWSSPRDEREKSRATVVALGKAGVKEPETMATSLAIVGKVFPVVAIGPALRTAEAELTATAAVSATATITPTVAPTEVPTDEPTDEPYPGPPPASSTPDPYPPPAATPTPAAYPGPETHVP